MAEVNLNLMPFARMARIGAINSDMEALAQSGHLVTDIPPIWQHVSHRLGPITLPALWSPNFQLVVISIMCLLLPGVYNAMVGMGAGGQAEPYWFDLAQTALYISFAVSSFFSGSFVDRVGIRRAARVCGVGYMMLVSSQLSYLFNRNGPFVVVAGAVNGLSAAVLWAVQGTMIVSYPSEESKDRFVSWFWMIFNSGAVLGALVSYHPS